MVRRTATAGGARRSSSSSRTTFIWIGAAAVAIIALIWTEQVALLYVLATLSVTALLLIVAMADLGGAPRPLTESAPNDDSAAVGDGLNTSSATTITARGSAKRR